MILYIVCTNVLHKWIFTTIIIIIFVVSYMYFVANYIVPTGTIEAPKWHSYSFRTPLIVLDHQQLSDWHKQNSAFSWIVNCWKINLQRNQRDHDKLDSEGYLLPILLTSRLWTQRYLVLLLNWIGTPILRPKLCPTVDHIWYIWL